MKIGDLRFAIGDLALAIFLLQACGSLGAAQVGSSTTKQRSQILIYRHQANPYSQPELKLIALDGQMGRWADGQMASSPPAHCLPANLPTCLPAYLPTALLSAPPQSSTPHSADQVLLSIYDAVNGALRANATLAGGSTNPTPHNADQVLLASYDSVNGAVRFNCVVGCVGQGGFEVNGTQLTSTGTINFLNSAATNGLTLTFSNPSAGQIQLGLSGNLASIAIPGSSATDQASLGSELTSASGWTSTGWTGSYSAGFTNGSSNTNPLSYTISGMAAGQYYLVTGTISGSTAGSLTLSLGGTTVNPGGAIIAPYWSGNGTWTAGVLTTGSGAFTVTPTSTFNGTFGSISVKQVSPITTLNMTTSDSTGAVSLEFSQAAQSGNNMYIGTGSTYPSGAYSLGVSQNVQNNVCVGPLTCAQNVTGFNLTAYGEGALRYNVSGFDSTCIGQNACEDNISGAYLYGIGQSSLQSVTTGYEDVGLGGGTLQNCTTCTFDLALGVDAMHYHVTDTYNIGLGRNAFSGSASSGSYNVVIGPLSFPDLQNNNNVMVGYSQGTNSPDFLDSVCIGALACTGGASAAPQYDVFIGEDSAVAVTSANYDVAIGQAAVNSLTTGSNNAILGYGAGHSLTTGGYNTAIGSAALYSDTTTSYLTAVGDAALDYETGANSTAVGYQAGYNNTGGGITAVGTQAGKTETTGANDTYLGYAADSSSAGLSNVTCLGYNTKCSTSNTMVFGSSSVTDAYFGSTTPSAQIHATNSVLSGHINQSATGNFAGTCSMSSSSSCTITLSAAFTSTPICLVTPQGTTAAYAACSVSGTTVTITASASNSLTWGALVIGNPN
jgi:hypothetical protein